MCGINGILAYKPNAPRPSDSELVKTRDHMAARGPDGTGVWWSEDHRVGLGHRRLAIQDLEARAGQPMTSACGRYVVTFNGEIYNYPALRVALEAKGRHFRTNSDTEVLLHLFEIRGREMLEDLRGMFAFAIWDTKDRVLFLARDPYGIKPLYISDDGQTLRFASQVKALLAGGALSRDPEPAGLVGYLLWGSVPEPFTLYRSICALPAGHSLTVDSDGVHAPESYASIAEIFASSREEPTTPAERALRVRAATLDSVRAHLLADVEVGVFLSAGVDSGALLGLMRDAGQKKISAITLTFQEFRDTYEDEAPLAAKAARLYGADHIVRTVGEDEFRADLPAILDAMDQPSIDGINTWFVSKATREAGLKVALSGLGGDEILAGYPSFKDIPSWTRLLRIPSAIPGLGKGVRMIGAGLGLGARNPKALGLLEFAGSYSGAYLLRRGLFLPFELAEVVDDRTLIQEGLERLAPIERLRALLVPQPRTPMAQIAVLESSQYMRNQLLRDSDWAGMAHSLEIRTPLVDTKLARELAPVCSHLEPGEGKRALAAAPSTPLPDEITNRNKTGFAVPTRAWMSSQLELDATLGAKKGRVSRAWSREVLRSFTADAAG